MKVALITGSAGLIGSQACYFFQEKGYKIVGIDNDFRKYFFGEQASTKKSLESIIENIDGYEHYNIDIRDYSKLEEIFLKYGSSIEIVIHTAAQPSHDWAAREPITDFSVNALGTINLLENTRKHSNKATFIFTSTNKVYGDRPNLSYYGMDDEYLKIKELETRYDGFDPMTGELKTIDENMSIDNSKHSLFGASKVSADIICQEYGKYFDMNVGIFRGGCLTGPNHAGTELHGFLSYLIKCIINDKDYRIYGYMGKQVRDNIHSWDLVNMFWHFHKNPKKGEVYNAGGGRENSISIIESISLIKEISNCNWDKFTFDDKNREGDHVWYISNLSKFQSDYPNWKITHNLQNIIQQMIVSEYKKMK